MGLFRRGGPVVFERHAYGRRRSWTVPRWLLWLLAGVAIGAGGLFYAQEEYLPPRLTPAESQQLQAQLGKVSAERQRLKLALDRPLPRRSRRAPGSRRLPGGSRQVVDRLQKDLALFDGDAASRARAVAVRGAKFANDGGQLAYHILLTHRERATNRSRRDRTGWPKRPGGRNGDDHADPVDVNSPSYQHLTGAAAAPTTASETIRDRSIVPAARCRIRVMNVR